MEQNALSFVTAAAAKRDGGGGSFFTSKRRAADEFQLSSLTDTRAKASLYINFIKTFYLISLAPIKSQNFINIRGVFFL